jgi:hypothetical protein
VDVHCSLVQYDLNFAICSVTVKDKKGAVTIYATALARESVRYADLAQQRALTTALRVLEKGYVALDDHDFVGLNETSVQPVVTTNQGVIVGGVSTHQIFPNKKSSLVVEQDGMEPDNNSSGNDVPW